MSRLLRSDWIYYSYYTDSDLLFCGIDKNEAEIGTQMLQSIANSDIVIIFKIKDEVIYFSFRSKSTPIDYIARYYGGWGHKHASWGAHLSLQSNKSIDEQLKQIVHKVGQMLTS